MGFSGNFFYTFGDLKFFYARCIHFIFEMYLFSVADVDGDDVRCRWAVHPQGECAGVCRAINAILCGVNFT